MTTCPTKNNANTELLLAYCAGRLRGAAALELERHIAGCHDCAEFRNAQSSVWNALDAWEAPAASPDFNRRLYARIAAAETAPWYTRWLESLRPVFARPAFPLAAVAVVVVAGFVIDHPSFISSPHAAKPTAVNVSGVTPREAEQVERTLDDLDMLRQFDSSADQNSEAREKTSKSM